MIGFHGNKKNPPFRFSREIFEMVLGPECIGCQKVRTIGPVLRPVHREMTDRQTNRGDQYTLQKSTILQSNKVKRRRIVIKFGTVLPVRVSTGSKKFQIFWIFFDDFRANNTL